MAPLAPLVLGALALWLLSGRSSGSSSSGASSLAGAQLVPTRATGGTDPVAWTRSRYDALRSAMAAVDDRNVYRDAAAAAIVAHWARETGWGRAEWNFNVGNIKAFNNWTGLYQRLADGLLYRAYPDIGSGIADTLTLLRSSRYRAAWDYLLSTGDGRGWYDRLMHAGWHPWSEAALTEFDSIRNRVRERVGA